MPRIVSDQAWNELMGELDAYRALGMTPDKLHDLIFPPDADAPLPLSDTEDLYPELDMKRFSGLLEGDDDLPIVDNPWEDK